MLYQLSYASAAQTEGGYQTGNTIASAVRPGASKSEANPSTSDALYTFAARMCQVNFTLLAGFPQPHSEPRRSKAFLERPRATRVEKPREKVRQSSRGR